MKFPTSYWSTSFPDLQETFFEMRQEAATCDFSKELSTKTGNVSTKTQIGNICQNKICSTYTSCLQNMWANSKEPKNLKFKIILKIYFLQIYDNIKDTV